MTPSIFACVLLMGFIKPLKIGGAWDESGVSHDQFWRIVTLRKHGKRFLVIAIKSWLNADAPFGAKPEIYL
jgi:hypothetical protein